LSPDFNTYFPAIMIRNIAQVIPGSTAIENNSHVGRNLWLTYNGLTVCINNYYWQVGRSKIDGLCLRGLKKEENNNKQGRFSHKDGNQVHKINILSFPFKFGSTNHFFHILSTNPELKAGFLIFARHGKISSRYPLNATTPGY
jgi:hypothetical protein